MTHPSFPEEWRIISSTSRFFPVHSKVRLIPRSQDPDRFDLAVEWEEAVSLLLLEDKEFPKVKPGTFRGPFDHPKESAKEQFELVVTVCPGPREKSFLCGFLTKNPTGTDPGATGVWVAEEQPGRKPPYGAPEE